MTQSLSDVLTPLSAQPLAESLHELRRTCSELDDFVHGIIQELGELHTELDQQRHQLADAWKELEVARRQSVESNDAALRQRVVELEQQRDELRRELDGATARVSKLAEAAMGAADMKAEAAKLKAELAEAKAAVAQAQQDLQQERQRVAAHSGEDALALRRELDELGRERSLVEMQLESVRERAAELTEQLEQQSQQFAEERKRWQSELSELRRLVVNQSRITSCEASDTIPEVLRQSSVNLRRTAPPPVEVESTESGGNPVIDSVMAQFQMVQREAARRRQLAS